MNELYQDDVPEQEPLYTAEDTVSRPDTNTGNYQVLKGIVSAATGKTDIPDKINFEQFVDDNWRTTVPDQNAQDVELAQKAASEGNVDVVQQAFQQVAARNALYGQQSVANLEATRAKLKELAEQATENVATSNPTVLINNTPQEIAQTVENKSKQLRAQATLQKIEEDGEKWVSGLGAEFLPWISIGQGSAIDDVAIKYGAPKDKINWTTGRSKTISYLAAAFNGTPDDQKADWLTNLYDDLKDSNLISDWQAALVAQQVVADAPQEWDGWSDWLDRLGAAGTVVGLGVAGASAKGLLKSANNLKNIERTIAAAGGKNAQVAAEGVKILNSAANAARLRAAGVVAGELTGIGTAIDLAKLVSLNATKVLPNAITTAASDLQKPIKQAVDKLIDELQSTIAGKGVRASEAAAELENLKKVYSPATNPLIHSVDNFVLSEDGLTISGKVYYKPEGSSAFLTKEAAEAHVATLDPTGKLGLKVVPDTTNTSFLVEESVKKDLQLRKTALEAQLLEALAASAPPKKTSKKDGKKPVKGKAKATGAPKALETSKPRYKTATLQFDDLIDKAAYQVGSKSSPSKSDVTIKNWLKSTTGWDDKQIAQHAATVRENIKANEAGAIETGSYTVPKLNSQASASAAGEGGAKFSSVLTLDETFDAISNIGELTRVGSISLGRDIMKNNLGTTIAEFHTRLGKALGMSDREIVVLTYDDALKGALKDPGLADFAERVKEYKKGANAVHFDYGTNRSVIVMYDYVSVGGEKRFIETFAHEYGHAFEMHFQYNYTEIMFSNFRKWLRAKGIKFTGTNARTLQVLDEFPPEALLEYRATTITGSVKRWVNKWMDGDVGLYAEKEQAMHSWLTMYSEFFAENFAKWATTEKVPTDILGQTFKKLADGFREIIGVMNEWMISKGLKPVIGKVDTNTRAMLEKHVELVAEEARQAAASTGDKVNASASVTPSVENLSKQLDSVNDQLQAIEDAEKGLKTGWLVSNTIEKKLDYSIIGTYTKEDIESATRFALGDWALSTSSELYAQRVVGINQQSRYQRLLTEFVRPSLEKLNKADKVGLNDALVLGDKEGKVFSETELAGMGLSVKGREAYYRVRALRDIMWQMRNDVAAKSMTRQGYVNISNGIITDEGDVSVFAKPVTPADGKFIYVAEDGKSTRASAESVEELRQNGYDIYETPKPVMVGGKYRKTFAVKRGSYESSQIREVIPYRAGEYRRIYSDEYFVKIESQFDIDGELVNVTQTHRTASSASQANAYVKAFKEAQQLYDKGELTLEKAASLLQTYGWKPEDVLEAFESGRFGGDAKINVVYNRTDDDYVNEAIGLSSSFSTKRGDRVLSVMGEDTVNTLSPMDSIASEIGNTAYVASTTEWREANIQRWFNSFVEYLPFNVRTMNPDQAFRYMLNNKGNYIGQSKELAVAEKVQDYIISQLNIPTKEEKSFLGAMRLISEGIEGATDGSKPFIKLGAVLRSTKDYPTWARTIAFHSFFAFNPIQFFMQGMNAFNAVAISPIHGLKSARSSALYAMALFSDQEEIWTQVAKVNKLTSLGLGMEVDEFVEVIRSIKRTGLLDGINTTSLYGAEVGKYGLFNGVRRRLGTVAATPFNSGEGYSRLVSFDIARREWMEANPGGAWWTDDNLAAIIERQDDLTQNMTRANVATWQQGWKSIPAQFVQYQVKLMMNVIQSILGNKRVFTRPEALRLLITHALVMGTAGNFLWPFRDLITDVLPEDMTEEQRLYVQQGVVSGLIGSFTEGEAQLALGSRFNTFKYYEDVIKGLLDPEKGFLEVMSGPSGFAAARILGGFGEGMSILAKAPMTMDTLQIALTEIGKSSFSAINNLQKARIAMANYNQVMSSSGGAMYRVTDTEAWLMAFGIPPAAQEDLSIMYSSRKAHADDIKSSAKLIGKHAMMALTALRNGDDEGHRTHAAIVQTIMNTYSGADYTQLMKSAYKSEAFTQLEKMLADQAYKQWQVNDLLVNTGVNE